MYTVHPCFEVVKNYFWNSCLDEVGCSGEASAEFLALYKRLVANGHWKYYLSLKGVLGKIANLINKVTDIWS